MDDIKNRVGVLEVRNSVDEVSDNRGTQARPNERSDNTGTQANSRGREAGDNTARGSDIVQPANLQSHDQPVQVTFAIIKDSVTRVRLPVDLKLHDSGNVKRKCQPVYNVVKRCARYTETILKLMSYIEPKDDNSSSAISDVYTCLRAEIGYLRVCTKGIKAI